MIDAPSRSTLMLVVTEWRDARKALIAASAAHDWSEASLKRKPFDPQHWARLGNAEHLLMQTAERL